MKLVVGLGNPGPEYRNSRHNLGFMALDGLAKDLLLEFRLDKESRSMRTTTFFNKEDVILCKPLTYMNLSGESVLKLKTINKLTARDILVVCDDISLELGRLRIRAKGSSGGHKGLNSIIKVLGSNEFSRLRIGVSLPKKKQDVSDYVLTDFSPSEKKTIRQALDTAKEAVVCWLKEGIETAMNKYNGQ
ncbi:MAG: aminoacyl-tRNA hydrolase [Omnitrophica WOR_2 bacterium GWB2_45_9]|nr:MAG: aminoacyl-tRNA hydrolase [Omnitrophica WOR_2 bacterium GWB2_45_9]OGX45990.1 MAG: aminoacyl-tRNA hydrolase [Omnitrophica WOR_2 bacterium RIFOXYA2_FULL_45_12]OGX52030.1 MAG: aminoacyl-tRNA hydrolase [Omnitrophica WOR_2 bacterium RIFOXYB2_FULL_45_11]OGX61308.1 MAG: aminoacyl-tRNA hydrolase [Omnitrophica WOR_2 bacterium RIFOXYC2_FULL_45_15]